ncbi:mandelate racemase/muconate lactonizing enzyme family protein [Acerihabitans arboris]|uniref:Mandelate racemase/muconate lactonizing enzyme family protein n=1 Tax=Acerihabitans arboris TaxID=2691583 RepID=A0A845SHH5_9GAMM|nr:mandelate racemase/muconate lactonizing enzyme family protein [Acerihabitans arboris]NDL64603.1 mandelate racemase/muconate lactonizing enzyme family protein [Acerihabitans arboris]
MKITGYRTLKTIHRWGRAIGDVNGVIPSGITEVPILLLTTDGGLTGVGLGAHGDMERIFPAIEGEDPRAVTALYDRILAYVFKSGHAGSVFGAIGAVDMALWDLKAKMAGEPLWRTLGARDPFVPGYASGLDYGLTLDELVALHRRFADRGFTGFKLKGGLDVEQDIERLQAVRQVYLVNSAAPAAMIDVNESMNRKQAVRYADRIGQHLDLTWIEEPVRRWDAAGHAQVSRSVKCAVATGENLTGLDQFTPLFAADAMDIVQTGMCWGITHFLRVAIAAHAHNLPISPVGYNANPVAHAAAAAPNHLSTEVQDLAFPVGLTIDQEITGGGILLGSAPGLGIEVDEDVIAAGRESGSWSAPAGPHVRPGRAGLRLGAEK